MKEKRGSFDVDKVRSDFPIFRAPSEGKPLIYLDSAATAQKPQCVIEAISRYYSEECGTVHRAVYSLAARATERYNAVREKAKRFLNASSEEEVIFTSGTTASLNLLAYAIGQTWIQPGDDIIISEMEHHSNLIPWQLLCERTGARLHILPVDDRADLLLDVYEKLLSEKTKIVSLAHMTNVTGTINPVRTLIALAHAVGAKVILDGAQAAVHQPIDVRALDVDFYVFSGHKLYGPTGVGVLYGKQKYLEELSPVFGGSDMIDEVELQKSRFHGPPLKFEPGTPPVASVLGLGAAFDYIESIGKEAIAHFEQELLSYASRALRSIDRLNIIGDPRCKGGILSFTIERAHALDVATLLSLKGIALRTGHLCAAPTLRRFGVSSLMRISFGIYTTHRDIDLCVTAIKEALTLLSPELSTTG